MKSRLQTLLASAKGRYLVVGASVYILELVVIFVAQKAGTSPVVAVSISFFVGLIVSFCLQKLVTFRDRRSQHRVVAAQALAVALLVLWNFGFTVGLTSVLSDLSPQITRTIALLITTIWNFYLYQTKIFTSGSPA